MTGGSFGGGASGGGGSGGGPAQSGTIFTDLRLTVQSQANALIAPSDSPTADTLRLVDDATNRVLWTWDASASTWKGVQVS